MHGETSLLHDSSPASRPLVARAAIVLAKAASLMLVLLVAGARAEPLPQNTPQATVGTLHVVWEQELPTVPSPALDVRWASDRSVYLARFNSVTEEALDGSFTRLRELIPDPKSEQLADHPFMTLEVLAASPEYVVASAGYKTMGFRTAPRQPGQVVPIRRSWIGLVEDLDLSGHQLLLLGTPKPGNPEGAGIAWLGPLSKTPGTDLKPVLFDAGGAGAPTLINCSMLHLGAARFLADGSFLVIPGSQPGAYHFNASGQLLQTWDTRSYGLDDIDCPGVSGDQITEFGRNHGARFGFISQHRVLDEILPLRQGPGLLIRRVAGGKVRWELKVLNPDGKVAASYEVPFTGEPPFDRLRGDVFGDRIVFLLAPHGNNNGRPGPPYRPTRILIAELPQATKGGSQ